MSRITLPIVRNTTSTLGPRTGASAYARAVRRFDISTDTFVGRQGQVFKKGTADGEESEVPADSIQNDLEYVVQVKIGTPGVTLNLFDKSDTRNISYGDGSSASGNVYTDAVTVGDVTIPNQAVELAENLSSSFQQDGGSDGLLGLAWPALNTVTPKAQATPVQNMIEQGIIDLPLFTANLDKGDSNGFYTFGVIDAAKAGVNEVDIKYTAVDNSQGFWMFPSTKAIINGQSIDLFGNTAIADTGTTLALVSDSVVAAIYAAIPGAKLDHLQGGYVYPADATLPDVEFAVGDATFKVNPADFSLGDAGNGMLFGGIQSRGGNPFDILGDGEQSPE
ncbi:hypothetical protein HWV62_38082 [Athelia sp. TMB]|nr:hypothetical protein HWV62_38082 [Athelia sp. TMB]